MSAAMEFTYVKDNALHNIFESVKSQESLEDNDEGNLENIKLEPDNSIEIIVKDEETDGEKDSEESEVSHEDDLENIEEDDPPEIENKPDHANTNSEESRIKYALERMLKAGFTLVKNKEITESADSEDTEEGDAENIELESSKAVVPEPECLLECEDEDYDVSQEDLGEGCSTDRSTEKLFYTDFANKSFDNSLSCNQCPYYTARADHLRRHMFRHKEKHDLKLFKCDSCDYQSPRKDHLKKHSVKHKAEHEIEKLRCPYCSYQIVRTDHMKNHIVKKHKDQLIMLECKLCSFQTPHEDVLDRHLLRHAGNKDKPQFKCEAEGCGYCTPVKRYLTRHINSRHNLEREYFKCSSIDCNYRTPRKDKLKSHISKIHGSDSQTKS